MLIGAAPAPEAGAQALPAITVTPAPGGGQTWSLTIQALLFLVSLTLLPALLLTMTSFTRIIIVLSLLRQALGTGLRWDSPVGLLRIDIAFPLDRQNGEKAYRLHFSLGQAF